VIAETDVDLAMRAQAAKFTNVHHLQYRRVIHPERSRTARAACASRRPTAIYHRGDLMPIHDRCKCEVLPIVGSKDPAGDQQGRPRRLYAAAGATAGDKSSASESPCGPRRARPGAHGQGHRWRGPDVAAA
jgi:hypothetical protein